MSLLPAPVDKIINPCKGPFHFILLKVDLKSYCSLGVSFDARNQIIHLERRVAMAFNPVRNAGALNLVHRGHLGGDGKLEHLLLEVLLEDMKRHFSIHKIIGYKNS